MGRKPNESETGRWGFLPLLFLALLSCSMVYLGLSQYFSPRTLSSLSRATMSRTGTFARSGDAGEEECCQGVDNLELWGAAVKWGTEFKFNSSKDCCRACKDMCRGDGPCLCDSWVFCGDRKRCGGRFGECWLKKQKETMIPEVRDKGGEVFWTSGLIFGNGEGIIALETEYGDMHIKLFPDCAPRSVNYIFELQRARHCVGCQFYRAEGRGNSWDSEGNHITAASFGPPFAMIQGTLESEEVLFDKIPKEVCPDIRRGSVAWVGSGPEFFISLANHNEWRRAYTVFGSVLPEDMEVAEKIAKQPTKIDVWNGIEVSVLDNPIKLRLKRPTTSKIS